MSKTTYTIKGSATSTSIASAPLSIPEWRFHGTVRKIFHSNGRFENWQYSFVQWLRPVPLSKLFSVSSYYV